MLSRMNSSAEFLNDLANVIRLLILIAFVDICKSSILNCPFTKVFKDTLDFMYSNSILLFLIKTLGPSVLRFIEKLRGSRKIVILFNSMFTSLLIF